MSRTRCSALWLAAAAAVSPWVSVPASAGSSSANYRLDPTAFSGGASLSTSANYSAFSGISGSVVGTSASSASSAYTAHYGFFPSAGPVDVTGRFAFYNQSSFDGNNAAANASDDNAIATDKRALQSGTATFANYTSYSRGLNGIMVDLPNGASPTASDFTFKRGNDNTPSGWVSAPAPSSVTVRAGAGVGGADRVTLIWPTSTSVKKEWIQVTVLSTANTGLSTPDTFYFGNAIGETSVGNSGTRFPVTSADVLLANNGPITSGAPITTWADHNRDGRVNSADPLISINNSAVGSLALIKLTLGGGDLASVARPVAEGATHSVEPDVPSLPRFMGPLEVSDGQARIWIAVPAGTQVQIEHSDDPAAGTWAPVPEQWLSEYETGLWQLVVHEDGPQRFFRIRSVESQAR